MAKLLIWNEVIISSLVFVCICIISANDIYNSRGYQIHLTPTSGILNLTRPDGLKMGLTFIGLTESDVHGTPIRTPGHFLTEADFAAMNFTSTDVCSRTVLHSTSVGSHYFYYNTTFSTLPSNARFATEVYFITSKGYVSNKNELTHVEPNDVKITFTISGWDWCVSCPIGDSQSVHGTFLDLKFALDLPAGSNLQQIGNNSQLPKTFSAGNNMEISLSRMVKTDDSWKTMGDPFPRIQEQNGRYVVEVRIPSFSSAGMYDPVFSLNTSDNQPLSDPERTKTDKCSGPGSRPPVSPSGATYPYSGSGIIVFLIAAVTIISSR